MVKGKFSMRRKKFLCKLIKNVRQCRSTGNLHKLKLFTTFKQFDKIFW